MESQINFGRKKNRTNIQISAKPGIELGTLWSEVYRGLTNCANQLGPKKKRPKTYPFYSYIISSILFAPRGEWGEAQISPPWPVPGGFLCCPPARPPHFSFSVVLHQVSLGLHLFRLPLASGPWLPSGFHQDPSYIYTILEFQRSLNQGVIFVSISIPRFCS